MSLKITRLVVRNFRSYEDFCLEPSADLTLLVGANAVGKTNLVEAIQLLTAAESFRRPQWAEAIRWGADKCSITLQAEGGGRVLTIEMAVQAGRREYKVNGKVRRRLSEIVGLMPSVVFVPDDLRLTKESAERRRTALDSLGSQISSSYLSLKNEYEKVVRQRNKLLKDETPDTRQLEAWTERLVETGAAFQDARLRLFSRLKPALISAHKDVAPAEDLEVRYISAAERDHAATAEDLGERIRQHLKNKAAEERGRGVTLAGPHRDDVFFGLSGRDVRTYASQGQHRSIALAWKLAEVAVIEEVIGQTPVLLLDDVMSELDQSRRHALASKAGRTAQTVITTTNTGYFEDELLTRAKVVGLG